MYFHYQQTNTHNIYILIRLLYRFSITGVNMKKQEIIWLPGEAYDS
jgi:hypothetical protein